MINQKKKNKNRKDFQIRLHQPQAVACGFLFAIIKAVTEITAYQL
nr:MAG TPA: hypothetical protein [Caudoviricetes sp.]